MVDLPFVLITVFFFARREVLFGAESQLLWFPGHASRSASAQASQFRRSIHFWNGRREAPTDGVATLRISQARIRDRILLPGLHGSSYPWVCLAIRGNYPFLEFSKDRSGMSIDTRKTLTREEADHRAMIEHAFKRKPLAPDVSRRVREREDRIREELKAKGVTIDAAELIRESREEI